MKNNAMITAINNAIISEKDVHVCFSVIKDLSSFCINITPMRVEFFEDYIVFYFDNGEINGDIRVDTLNIDFIEEMNCYVCSGEESVFHIYL